MHTCDEDCRCGRHRSRDPLDEYDTLADAREGLQHLEALRSFALPVVLLGLVFAAGITWLDAQLVVWGGEPLLAEAPFSWVLLTIWTVNAVAGVQFLLLTYKAYSLRSAMDHFYAQLPATVDSRGR